MSDDYNPEFDEFQSEDPFQEAEFAAAPLNGGEDAFAQPLPEEEEVLSGPEKPRFRRPRLDLYTVLLVLSLIFIVIATMIHHYECTPYEYGKIPYKASSQPLPPPSGS